MPGTLSHQCAVTPASDFLQRLVCVLVAEAQDTDIAHPAAIVNNFFYTDNTSAGCNCSVRAPVKLVSLNLVFINTQGLPEAYEHCS